jgi:penicillin-binding protein 1A
VQPLLAPEGVVAVGADWRYAEWAEGGFASRVGPAPAAAAPAATAEPASAASTAAR